MPRKHHRSWAVGAIKYHTINIIFWEYFTLSTCFYIFHRMYSIFHRFIIHRYFSLVSHKTINSTLSKLILIVYFITSYLLRSSSFIIYLHIYYRNIQFFGMESQQKVSESFVVVIGLGGVGSHAACMLLRSGVRKLRLVDFDQVIFYYKFILYSVTLTA